MSYNNFSSGITSVAVPVKNKHKEIIAAVELIGNEQRLRPVSIQKYLKLVIDAAAEMETRLVGS
ncbi:IclR family transcriptional regulator domain-containing protein [Neobacillus cucumis]|uniref:IclR-ED domain-containing protein n=1 Tax=Neobacillus cucumis TaxID=1740721 RepID=A0A2N5H8J2_9BACI|nr:IclR family transcriptional regulator C-terminal domain-containing protein [Neobacillus cucumis]PLS01820.1 hypothetical protein CVD27_23000 [Neobacillus cucumis]